MAKRFDTGDPNTPLAWALEECEDVLIIDAYLEIRDELAKRGGLRLSADQLAMQRLVAELDQHYFTKGNGIADKTLIRINNILGGLYLEKIELINGHSTDYSLMRGPEKAERRRKIRETLKGLEARQRSDTVDDARNRARMVVARRDLEVATDRPRPFPPSLLERGPVAPPDGPRLWPPPGVASAKTAEPPAQPMEPPSSAPPPASPPAQPVEPPSSASPPAQPVPPLPVPAEPPPARPEPGGCPSLEDQIRMLIRARLDDQDRATLMQILNLMK